MGPDPYRYQRVSLHSEEFRKSWKKKKKDVTNKEIIIKESHQARETGIVKREVIPQFLYSL